MQRGARYLFPYGEFMAPPELRFFLPYGDFIALFESVDPFAYAGAAFAVCELIEIAPSLCLGALFLA